VHAKAKALVKILDDFITSSFFITTCKLFSYWLRKDGRFFFPDPGKIISFT
jgi:hypothetical protein